MISNFIKKHWEALTGLIMLGAAFGAGWYLTPAKVETHTVTIEVEHKDEDTKTNTVIVEKIDPNGTINRTTTTNNETKTTTDRENSITHDKIVTTNKSDRIISLLSGVDLDDGNTLIFGAAVTQRVIGPFSIGLWGLSNKTIGASVGFEF